MTSGPEAVRLPEPGDLVWVDFSPTRGREQTGVRPALVLTSRAFHERDATAEAVRGKIANLLGIDPLP